MLLIRNLQSDTVVTHGTDKGQYSSHGVLLSINLLYSNCFQNKKSPSSVNPSMKVTVVLVEWAIRRHECDSTAEHNMFLEELNPCGVSLCFPLAVT